MSEESQPLPGTIEAAVAAAEAVESGSTEQVAETQQVEAQQESKGDGQGGEVWSRISKLDAENRELRKQLKGFEGKKTIEQALADDPDSVWNAYMQSIGVAIDQEGEPSQEAQPEVDNQSALEIASLRKELEEMKRGQMERQYEAMLRSEKNSLGNLVENNPDKWPVVKAFGSEAYDLALQVAQAWVRDQGGTADAGMVLDQVEEHLRGEVKRYSDYASLLEEKKPQPAPAPSVTDASPGSPSLISGNEETPAPRDLTDEELFQRALAAMEQADG
ncbi:MAG: hypothetical protein QNJ16_18830 [Rhodobacter sp.]|nr:hypothetical protein [Rhodobacter sp.]